MSREIGSILPYSRELEMPAMALPLGYVLSQQWGSLHVTAAASEAYGLRPSATALALDESPVPVASGAQHDPQIHIWLIAPRELAEPAAESEAEAEPLSKELAPASEVYLHDKGVGMTAEFGHDKAFMAQLMASFFEHKTGQQAETLLSYRPAFGTSQPLMKDIEQDVPRFFAHLLNEGVQENLPAALYARERLIERRQALSLATRALVLPPLAAGASVAAAEIGRFGELSLPVAAIAAAGVAAGVVRSGIKTYLSLSERMENSMRDSAKLKAIIVGSRIEAAFKPQPAETGAADPGEEA